MTELDQAIANAFASEGKQDEVNKVYLTLLRTPLYVPVEKMLPQQSGTTADDEPFKPLFAKVDGNYFLLAFDSIERLSAWAADEMTNIGYVELLGRDVIAGINEQVYFCLNLGTEFYKEFSPEEVQRLKMVVSRIEQLRGAQ